MRVRQVLSLTAAAVLAAAGALVVFALPATATTFSVTNSNNSGAGSLRQAFIDASGDPTGPHTIDVQAGLAPIALTTGVVYNNATNQPLTIHGNGNKVTSAQSVFLINSPSPLSVERLTMTQSPLVGADTIFSGVAADVTLTNSTIDTVGRDGIDTFGSVTLTNSTINKADQSSGEASIDAGPGTVTLVNSTVSNGGAVGVREFSSSAVTVKNSTISDNSTLGIISAGPVTLVYATVVGSGSNNVSLVGNGTLTSFGSVVALRSTPGANCSGGSTTSNGFNFSDDASCGFSAGTDRQSAGDPKLGALANNGGSTLTRLPLVGSPLIDAIPPGHCSDDGASTISPLVDQIGLPRPQGAGCEIGAKEVPVTTPTTTAPTVLITPKFTG